VAGNNSYHRISLRFVQDILTVGQVVGCQPGLP